MVIRRLSIYVQRSLRLLGPGLLLCAYFPLADKGHYTFITSQHPTLWRAEFTHKEMQTLHSSLLNGAQDYSVCSLLLLAQPDHSGPTHLGHWHSALHLVTCWGLVALGMVSLPRLELPLCHFEPGQVPFPLWASVSSPLLGGYIALPSPDEKAVRSSMASPEKTCLINASHECIFSALIVDKTAPSRAFGAQVIEPSEAVSMVHCQLPTWPPLSQRGAFLGHLPALRGTGALAEELGSVRSSGTTTVFLMAPPLPVLRLVSPEGF